MITFLNESLSRIQKLEITFLWYVQNSLRTRSLDIFMMTLSKLGNLGLIWFFLGFILFLSSSTRIISYAIVFGLVTHVIVCNFILKNLFARTRPDLSASNKSFNLKYKDYSFPSGHTCSSFIVASVLYYLTSALYFVALPIAILMGFSRMYLGAHYPSDVIFGGAIGWAIGYASYTGVLYLI